MTKRRRRRTMVPAVLGIAIVVLVNMQGLGAQRAADRLAGRRLVDALQILESTGLRIVFSSELVTPDMRVRREPKAKTSRERLVEILEPHGLGTKEGADDTIVVVRKPKPRPDRLAPKPPSPPTPDSLEPSSSNQVNEVFRTDVTVTTDPLQGADLLIGASRRLDAEMLSKFGSRVSDDPVHTLQSLPGVGTGNDYRGELSVRASPYRHAAVVVEGVPAPWLQHAAVGRIEAGTLTMLPANVVQDAILHVGAYARRDSGQLGPQVTLTLREGSRERLRWRAATSTVAATLTGEGPIGRAKRGSWLIGLRKSYVSWPLQHEDHERSVFGFGDLQAKAVYDARSNQQISVSLIAGLSNVERDDTFAAALGDGVNRAALGNLGFRSAIGTGTVVRQQVSFQTHTFANRDQAYDVVNRGAERSGTYRADLTHTFVQNVLETGVVIRRTHGLLPARSFTLPGNTSDVVTLDGARGMWWERAGYASFRWHVTPDLELVSGVRLAVSTLGRQGGVDRWLQIEWSRLPHWRVFGSAGVAHQFVTLDRTTATNPARARPERATYLDVGVSHEITASVRWQASIFTRRERHLFERHLVPPDVPSADGPPGLLTSNVRGFDLTIERTHPDGLAGWVGYTFTLADYTDQAHHETFRADFDQRHMFTLAGSAPIGWHSRLGLTFRAGTETPIPGYLVWRDGSLYLGPERNQTNRPAYSRLDLRAERRFDLGGRPFTAFAEVINLFDHANFGLSNGYIIPGTGQAIGFTERLYSRLLTGGVLVDF